MALLAGAGGLFLFVAGRSVSEGDKAADGPRTCSTRAEAECRIFLLDLGGRVTESGALQRAKVRLEQEIHNMSPTLELAIVAFARGVGTFPPSGRPLPASADVKRSAVAWVRRLAGGCGTSVAAGFGEAFRCADRSTAPRKSVTFLGDVSAVPERDLDVRAAGDSLRAHGDSQLRIDCIDVLHDRSRRIESPVDAASATRG